MSADLLRRAAAKIRETAQAATPGPWIPTTEGLCRLAIEIETRDLYSISEGDHVAREFGRERFGVLSAEDAAHIALWSPLVAELVAQWLDAAARRDEQKPRPAAPHDVQAHRLALFILGEDA